MKVVDGFRVRVDEKSSTIMVTVKHTFGSRTRLFTLKVGSNEFQVIWSDGEVTVYRFDGIPYRVESELLDVQKRRKDTG